MTIHYMVLQNGRPMQTAANKADLKIWALFFASSNTGPSLFKTYQAAKNAIRRQKTREKRRGYSLGQMWVMRIVAK